MVRAMSRPTSVPSTFSAGSTVVYERYYGEYLPTNGYTLTAFLAGAKVASSVAVGEGVVFVVTLDTTTTAALTAGDYQYVERVSKSGIVTDVYSGTVRVTPNLATATDGSVVTPEEKLLAAIDACILGKVTDDLQEYTIGGRAVVTMDPAELWRWRNRIASLLQQRRAGGRFTQPVNVVFTVP